MGRVTRACCPDEPHDARHHTGASTHLGPLDQAPWYRDLIFDNTFKDFLHACRDWTDQSSPRPAIARVNSKIMILKNYPFSSARLRGHQNGQPMMDSRK